MQENPFLEQLSKINPLLAPEELGKIFPLYNEFSKIPGFQYLYSKKPLPPLAGQVILTIDAPPTGGQSSVLRLLSKSSETVIAPTLAFRPPRPDEQKDISSYENRILRSFHYLHIPEGMTDHDLLRNIMEENPLWTRYAISLVPIQKALETGKNYILMVLDQHGTGILKKKLPAHFPGISVLSLEILPQLRFKDYLGQIEKLRDPAQITERIRHATGDLENMPCCADIIGLNAYDPSLTPEPLVTELKKILGLS